MECMKNHSTVLADIGLALLKFVSSHRGLTSVLPYLLFFHANLTDDSPEIFDEYTRRQYMAKAPSVIHLAVTRSQRNSWTSILSQRRVLHLGSNGHVDGIG